MTFGTAPLLRSLHGFGPKEGGLLPYELARRKERLERVRLLGVDGQAVLAGVAETADEAGALLVQDGAGQCTGWSAACNQ